MLRGDVDGLSLSWTHLERGGVLICFRVLLDNQFPEILESLDGSDECSVGDVLSRNRIERCIQRLDADYVVVRRHRHGEPAVPDMEGAKRRTGGNKRLSN